MISGPTKKTSFRRKHCTKLTDTHKIQMRVFSNVTSAIESGTGRLLKHFLVIFREKECRVKNCKKKLFPPPNVKKGIKIVIF